jgi:hypothetical protein
MPAHILAVHDKAVLRSLNKDALFWQTQMHCLQTSLFLTVSRIFDTEGNAHTIHTLVNATLSNLIRNYGDVFRGHRSLTVAALNGAARVSKRFSMR